MGSALTRVVDACWRRVAAVGAGVVLTGAAALAGPGTASAATSVKVDCPSDSLQAAIASAAPGTRLIVTGTCPGNFTIDKDLTLLGQGTAVLDGQNAGTTLAVSSGATVRVHDLRITGGSGELAGGGISNGFFDSGGTLTLRGSVVSGNFALVAGGGIVSNGTLRLKETTVSDNIVGAAGGGIFNSESGNAKLDDSTVSGNTTLISWGGGIENLAALTLNDTRVSGNRAATFAGGIINFSGNATLNDSTVSGNTAGTNGGGIFLNAGEVTLNDTPVTDNVPDNCFPLGSVAGCSG